MMIVAMMIAFMATMGDASHCNMVKVCEEPGTRTVGFTTTEEEALEQILKGMHGSGDGPSVGRDPFQLPDSLRAKVDLYAGVAAEGVWKTIVERGNGTFHPIREIFPGVWLGVFTDPATKTGYFAVQVPRGMDL